ncbi:MAG TPA: outer membrane beta-barrel protein [Niastella sp.]
MKKVLTAAFLLVSSNAIFAQVNQGQWLAGGSVGFNHSSQGDSKQTDIMVSPDLGYFFINQFAAGLRPEFGYTKTKTKVGSTTSTGSATAFSIAPFLRYYFMPSGDLNVFADASYGFGSSKVKGGTSVSGNYYQIKAGPALFLSPNTALEFALYYRSWGGDAYEVNGDRNNNFGLSIGFQVHLGGGGKIGKK